MQVNGRERDGFIHAARLKTLPGQFSQHGWAAHRLGRSRQNYIFTLARQNLALCSIQLSAYQSWLADGLRKLFDRGRFRLTLCLPFAIVGSIPHQRQAVASGLQHGRQGQILHRQSHSQRIQGGNANQRQVQRQRHALGNCQSNTQTGKGTRTQRNPQGSQILRFNSAAHQQRLNRRGNFHSMMIVGLPQHFANHLRTIIQCQAHPLGGTIHSQKQVQPPYRRRRKSATRVSKCAPSGLIARPRCSSAI